jgi:hypothetical protein
VGSYRWPITRAAAGPIAYARIVRLTGGYLSLADAADVGAIGAIVFRVAYSDYSSGCRQLRRPKKEGGAGLGENTARRICGRSRQFFRAAQRNRLIAENPFADMTCITVQANRRRDYFITREDAAKVLEACPDSQ